MRSRRLLVLVAAALFAAWLAPQAFAQNQVGVLPYGPGSATIVATTQGNPAPLFVCEYSNGEVTPISSCTTAPLAPGTVVTITVNPAPGTAFNGFIGGPGGSQSCQSSSGSTCTFTAGTAGTIVYGASFGAPKTLVVTRTGSGSGTVLGPSINCGNVCIATYSGATASVTLMATAGSGSVFVGWGGACAFAGSNSTCVLPLPAGGATTTVTANFGQLFQLNVTNAGNGSGTTGISPGSNTCPPTCTLNAVAGTQVTLTATPASGSVAGGFSGACVSSGTTCTFTVNGPASVTATYNLAVVQATVVGRKTTKTGNVRRTRVTIDAEQVVDVDISIVRGGRELAGRVINNFRPGERNVFVRIPSGVAGGRAQLIVEMTNNFGVEKTQRFNIRIPSLG